MTRIVSIVIALFAVLSLCTSCMDEDPAELSVRTSQAGQPQDCNVMLYNSKGVQVQEHFTERGFIILKALKPGTYYIKLKTPGATSTMYKAIRKVEIKGGDSKVVDIDLDDASKNPTDMPGEAPATP